MRRIANRILGTCITFDGPYTTWNDAETLAAGYDDPEILHRVLKATQQVLSGSANYEQDGKTFHNPPPPSHALSGLLLGGARAKGRLSILDFGGGLASHYLRWRSLLSCVPDLHWNVVEQSAFVEVGKKLFAEFPEVNFHLTIDSAAIDAPTAIYASSVLQYLPQPFEALQKLCSLDAQVLVLDRIPFSDDEIEHILIQRVPPHFGKASYPLRTFPISKLEACLAPRWRCIAHIPAMDAPIRTSEVTAHYGGSVWVRT